MEREFYPRAQIPSDSRCEVRLEKKRGTFSQITRAVLYCLSFSAILLLYLISSSLILAISFIVSFICQFSLFPFNFNSQLTCKSHCMNRKYTFFTSTYQLSTPRLSLPKTLLSTPPVSDFESI